jgi:hypothetical protein
MCRFSTRAAVVLSVLLLLPAAAYSQAAITGVVRDTSGGVLPGVTVEAASQALIEKVRSVVSDDTGQYRIVDLRPGTYSVTFSLPGFTTVKREGIELSGTFVATVNGDLRVGALEETVTVTGETPIVDVQSAKVQQTVSKDVLAAIPSSRTATGIQALIPGLSTGANAGGISGASEGAAGTIHGGRGDDSRMMNDGLVTTWNNGSGGGGNNANVAGAQEVVISTSGGLGEAETAGVQINLIPREGGNAFTGTFAFSGANGAMQGSNYTEALKLAGLRSPQELKKVYDINPMGGGRIIRDRLWFYNTLRIWGAHNTVPGMFWNKNAGDPNAWTYEPDESRPTIDDNKNGTAIGRITWQATPRNKINLYWSEQWNCSRCVAGGNATTTTEAQGRVWYHPSRVQQATWSSPATSRILLEAGWGTYQARYRQFGDPRDDGTYNPLLIQVLEQRGKIPGLTYRAPRRYDHSLIGTMTWRASMSYVTGAHGMKFGYYGGFLNPSFNWWQSRDDGILQYRFSDGVPNQITFVGGNPVSQTRNLIPTSFYAQDQWTAGRLTLQGGLRFDRHLVNYPEQRFGGLALLPVEIVFPSRSTPGLDFKDITPRVGAAYDLFGTGKTAVKVTLGKYPSAIAVQSGDLDANPVARAGIGGSGTVGLNDVSTRTWNDANKNYVPECDFANFAKNGECEAVANQNYGTKKFTQSFDPSVSQGWSNRPYEWNFGLSVQQELLPRVSATVGYYRRWFGNFLANDNRAVAQSDFDLFTFPLAADARLPDGGGYTVGDQYDVSLAKFGQVDNLRTAASDFGRQVENWHGVDVGVVARLRNGLTVQGGTSTGRTLRDNCDVVPKIDNPSRRFCRVVEPFLTQVRGLATYLIPLVDVQVSGTWSSNPGGQLAANLVVSSAVARPSLSRNLSGGNVTVNLVEPGTLYGARVSNLDFRVSKILRFRRTRTQVGLDLYNIMNNDVVTTYNQMYVPGGAWLTPTAILPARYVKFSAQFDF